MSTGAFVVGALLISAIAIVRLCSGDPKRLRASGLTKAGASTGQRRLLAGLACLPGLLCAMLGDAAAVMLWLGGSALLGWAAATWSAARPDDNTC